MQLKDIKQGFIPTREQILKALTTGIVIVLCALAGFAVQIILKRGTSEQIVLAAVADPAAVVPEPSETEITEASVVETETTTETAAVSETSETSETSESETEETTKATTAATTAAITESDLQLAVYATTVLNVRSGPGTGYDVVKQVNPGDQIDVVAVTSNGWYKTYNGNYVSADLTTQTPPTPTPTPAPAATPTPAPKQTTPASTTAAIDTSSGVSCKITFYGPQDNGDGSYSLTTATGATCTQGVTVAADWSVYPAGTVIYIENDPLGGDGYYTVQDKGSGVKGAMIDIFVEDTSQYSTTTRTVYLG
ncbi:MAG: SH3 domain-containing protein [Clostridiales bacterium]|nr:SH3 domain-containing protein [Clostridiales bacterium]